MMGKFNYKNWATLLAILVLFFSFGLAVRADAPAPTKISPEGTNVSAVVALQWNSVDGADKGYHYAVYLLSTQEVAAEDTITGTGATLTLSAGTSYYWNVESCWGSGFANWGRTCSGWTEPSFTFTTQGVAPATPPASTPPPPTKISPYDGANDAQIISSMNVGMSGVHFNWESVNGADKGYHYIVSGGGNNFEDTIDKTELILNLAYGTNYQWNVESCWGSGLFGWGRTCGGWGPLFTFTTMLNPNVNAPSNPSPGGINIICGMDFTDAKGETESAGNWCSDECAKGSIHQTYHFLKDGKHYSFRCYCSAPSGYYFGSTNCDSATAIVENCSVGQNWTCTKGGGCSGGYCTTLTGCTCSDWTVGQCNAGGCTGQRQYTRNCNPTGCDKESDCRSGASDVECKMPGFKKEGEFCNDASVFCQTGLKCCLSGLSGTCKNLSSDASNCGACDKSCGANQCVNGVCVSTGCGNGIKNSDEDCDGTDLGGQTCGSKGLGVGTLGCSSKCKFDFSGCTIKPVCGNNKTEIGEECDGNASITKTCKDSGFASGVLGCTSQCTFDKSGCTGVTSPSGPSAPSGVVARTNCPTAGFVPCGNATCPCQLCDFFVLFDKIIKFILFKLVPPIAVLMIMIIGAMYFLAAGDPGKLEKAKALIKSVVIGLLIIYGAWIIVNTFFMGMGVAEWTGLTSGWFKYPCQ